MRSRWPGRAPEPVGRAGQEVEERAAGIPADLRQPVVAPEHLDLHRGEIQLRPKRLDRHPLGRHVGGDLRQRGHCTASIAGTAASHEHGLDPPHERRHVRRAHEMAVRPQFVTQGVGGVVDVEEHRVGGHVVALAPGQRRPRQLGPRRRRLGLRGRIPGDRVGELAAAHPQVVEEHAKGQLSPALGRYPPAHLVLARQVVIGVLVRHQRGAPGPDAHLLEPGVTHLDQARKALREGADRIGEPGPEPVIHDERHGNRRGRGEWAEGRRKGGEQHRRGADTEPGRECPGRQVAGPRLIDDLPETWLPLIGQLAELMVRGARGQPFEVAHRRIVRATSGWTALPPGLLQRLHRRHRRGAGPVRS